MRTFKTVFVGAAVACCALVTLGCGSSGGTDSAPDSTGRPSVAQIGRTQVRTLGADLEGIVSYKFADANLGEEWLIITTAITGQRAEAIEIKQADVSVRTPDGRRVVLPTQKEFIEAYPQVQSMLRRAAVASEPLEATRADKRPCDLNFLRIPGTGTTRDAIWINERELCVGMLAFPIQGGVQPGRWMLIVELEESSLEIPFDLGR